MKRVLNVGGNNREIPLPEQYAGFAHLLLDIDPRGNPDIVCDARNLTSLSASEFDAVYCSHNLEHYYRHDVRRVLAGFVHVIKDGGFAHIVVPDIGAVMRAAVRQGLDIDDVLYHSPMGPIRILDVLYGHEVQIEQSGQDYFAHKTGFTEKSLMSALGQAGFSAKYSLCTDMQIVVIAFKGVPDQAALALFGLS